jgi:hypothetical protein
MKSDWPDGWSFRDARRREGWFLAVLEGVAAIIAVACSGKRPPQSGRRTLLGSLALLVALLGACGSATPQLSGPYAHVIPNCFPNYKERSNRYESPPKGSAYKEARVTALTSRLCRDMNGGDHWLWMDVPVFSTSRDASAYVRDMSNYGREAHWLAPSTVDQWSRRSSSSSFIECEHETELEPCSVGDSLWARVGRMVVSSVGEDRDAHILAIGTSAVVSGDARPSQNEQLVESMLRRLR